MCVLALAWNAHPRWRLVVAGNRDELHDRPAAALRRWEAPNDHLLAGQDLRSGGTWLGVSEKGRFAVVTNLRGHGAPVEGRPSRGQLLTDFLSGKGPYADPAQTDLAIFNPLNLLSVQHDQLTFSTNRPAAQQRTLANGVYGLSNGALDEPWPKTVRLTSILADWLAAGDTDPKTLLAGLAESVLPAVGHPTASPSDVPQEPPLSAIFIRSPLYGTRCSSVVTIDHAGHGEFIERRFNPQGEPVGETVLPFDWPEL
jgi:uncharacterized protein with NRDE domain